MLNWSDTNAIHEILAIMRSGRVVVGTSDTVLGFLAPLTKEGFEALNTIKKRGEKPYLVLIKSPSEVKKFIDQDISPHIAHIMEVAWPGPLTLIFKAKADLPDYVKSIDGTIALRVPAHAGLQHLLTHCNGLFSTSANKAGKPVPDTIDQLDPDIVNQVAEIVIDNSEDELHKPSLPSTILDCSGDHVHVVREGAYSVDELLKKRG